MLADLAIALRVVLARQTPEGRALVDEILQRDRQRTAA